MPSIFGIKRSKDRVGPEAPGQFHGFLAVCGFSDDLDLRVPP
jgi:hypothetical protein